MAKSSKSKPPAPPKLTRDELVIINNALNEVCHGVDLDDDEFHARIGYSREAAQKLLMKVGKLLGR